MAFLPFPLLKSTGDDKHDIEVYVEDLVDYSVMNNWYDSSKQTDEAKWIKPDKVMACCWCGGQHRQPRQQFCPAFRRKCNKCGILGHFSRVCRSGKSYQVQHEKANQIQEESEDELFAVESHNAKKFFAHITLLGRKKNREIRAQIDSASTCKLKKSGATICTYGNQKIVPNGKITLCCEAKGKFHLLDFLVVDVPIEKPALLSGSDAQKLGYLKIYPDEVQAVDLHNQQKSAELPPLGHLTKESILTHYEEVFKPGRGKPLGDPLHIEVDPSVKPVQAPRRRIPVAKLEKVNKEVV